MEIRQLEYFHEIAATGSIHEAARRLNMSQPPLSYQIKQLEAELNVKLFERTRAGVTLTEAGKLLYDRTENILNYVRSTELEVSKAGKKQVLRIGITPTTVTTIMPYISRFSRENSDVNFEVRDAITFTLLNYLIDGIIDVSVVRTPIKLEGLNYLELSEEPMIAVLPPAFPENRTKKEGISLKKLTGRPLIIYRRYEEFLMKAFGEKISSRIFSVSATIPEMPCSGCRKALPLPFFQDPWKTSVQIFPSGSSKKRSLRLGSFLPGKKTAGLPL